MTTVDTVFINPKALQLSIIMLRQYKPAAAKLLPGPEHYPLSGDDIPLHLNYSAVTEIIGALNDLGQIWYDEANQFPNQVDRNRLRKDCLAFILEEWIHIGEQYEQAPQSIIH